jgi:broad specificity phosphatase PhoE
MDDVGANQRIALFTSGGVIGRTVQWTMGAPLATALELNWRVRNTSVTEFLFSKRRISLDLFNATSHLPPELITYR